MGENENKDTNVTVEVTGADNLEVTFEEVPAETESKGKLNVGAVALAGLAIGGTIFGVRKAVKYFKGRKAAKEAEILDEFEEEIVDEEIEEEEEAPEPPKTKAKAKSGKGKTSKKKEEESGDEEEQKAEETE